MWDISTSWRLLFVGPETKDPITSLAVENDAVYATSGPNLLQYHRGKLVHALDVSQQSASPSTSTSMSASSVILTSLITFGTYACALSSTGKTLYVFTLPTSSKRDKSGPQLHSTIDFGTDFAATKMVHPSTYLNKVVLGSKEGHLQIWNIATRSLIHQFDASDILPSAPGAAITCVVQSPAIDVLAIGYSTGQIAIFDVRKGELLLSFSSNSSTSSIAALSFRTDNLAQTLASSDESGNIALWDLEDGGKLMSLLRRAHEREVTGLVFLPGQPVLMSAGADNAMRQWLFDTPTSPPRLLKYRSGHHSPPSLIRFYNLDGKSLLTASSGDRSLRLTSLVRESRSTELSQGHLQSKLTKLNKLNKEIQITEMKFSPITGLAFPTLGQGTGGGGGNGVGSGSYSKKDWDDLVTVHKDEAIARSWSGERKALGKHTFHPSSGEESGRASAVGTSACGNFALAGYERGDRVIMWNLQSGIKRREFAMRQTKDQAVGKRASHVTGIESDSLNTSLVISTLAGQLQFFDFHTAEHLHTLALPAGVQSTLLQRDNNILACVCDDMTVRLVDIETRRIIREFAGFKGRIVDIAFSHDSRWLVTTSTDAIIRTFDIPTGMLVDAFRTKSVATTLAFSPTGEFLATGHVDSVGVYLWTNRAQFSEVTLRSIDEDDLLASVATIDSGETAGALPSLRSEEVDALDDPTSYEADPSLEQTYPTFTNGTSEAQLSSSLVTLSLLPRSKWSTLLNLETIQARNKPVEPPKKPENAPFFLPTLSGTDLKFDLSASANGQGGSSDKQESEKRRLAFGGLEVESPLLRELRKEAEDGSLDHYDTFFGKLLALSASALDLEIRSLSSTAQLVLFCQALTSRLESRKDFEAVQAVMKVFLGVHADALTGSSVEEGDEGQVGGDDPEMQIDGDADQVDALQEALQGLLVAQVEQTKAVGNLVRTSLGMIAWTRGVPVV